MATRVSVGATTIVTYDQTEVGLDAPVYNSVYAPPKPGRERWPDHPCLAGIATCTECWRTTCVEDEQDNRAAKYRLVLSIYRHQRCIKAVAKRLGVSYNAAKKLVARARAWKRGNNAIHTRIETRRP
jgi:hypothetical protein